MKKKRILFAAVDIGYRIELYTNYINTHLSDRLTAESFSKYTLPDSHYKSRYTYTCHVKENSILYVYSYCFFFFIFSLFRYNIFHFFSGETILTRRLRPLEFMCYKLFGKKIIMHFVGADIRNPEFLAWKEQNIESFIKGNRRDIVPKHWQKKLIKDSIKYADEIIVSTPDLLKIMPHAQFYPVVIDLPKFLSEIEQITVNDKLNESGALKKIILHAPSNTSVKGSKIIHNVLYKLKEKYPEKIELMLPGEKNMNSKKLYSVTRYELFGLLKKSDIMIDQLIIGWYGLQAIEALLVGCKVVCYIEEELEKYMFENTPIINANALNIETVLESIINNNEGGKEKVLNEHIEWVKKHHTIDYNNEILIKAWGWIQSDKRTVDFIRKLLIVSRLDEFVAKITRDRLPDSILGKIAPNNYQYKRTVFKNIITSNGVKLKVDPNDYMGHYLFFGFKNLSHEALLRSVNVGDVVIDVGANIGYSALEMASKVGDNGKIIGFEPDINTYNLCVQNIGLNTFTNIKILNIGLGASDSEYYLESPIMFNRGANRVNENIVNGNIKIKIKKLDDIYPNLGLEKINVIKIDVEGYEYNVLKGAQNLISKHKPKIFIEISDLNLKNQNSSAKQLILFLEENNYKCEDVISRELITADTNLNNCHIDVLATVK